MPRKRFVRNPVALWVPVGLALGAGVGVAIGNIAVGIGFGLLFGAFIGVIQRRKIDKDNAAA